MSKSAYTAAQIIGAVKQMEAGRNAEEVARKMAMSKHTIYALKQKYGGLDVAEAQELKALRDENTRLTKLVANRSLDKDALQHVIQKAGTACRPQGAAPARACGRSLPMSERQVWYPLGPRRNIEQGRTNDPVPNI